MNSRRNSRDSSILKTPFEKQRPSCGGSHKEGLELERRSVQDLSFAIAVAESLVEMRRQEKPKLTYERNDNGKNGRDHIYNNEDPVKFTKSNGKGDRDENRGEKPRIKCFFCEGPHKARKCPMKNKLSSLMEEQERLHDEACLGSLNLISFVTANFDEPKSAKKGQLFVETKVRNHIFNALLDTGANNNFLEVKEARRLGIRYTKEQGWLKVVNSAPNFSIIDMDDYKMVLGIKFLDKVNVILLPSSNMMCILDQGNTRTIPLTREGKRETRHLSVMQLSRGMNKRRVVLTITNDKAKEISTNNNEIQGDRSWNSTMDWTELPGDTVIQLFSLLNDHDRVNLSSVCQSWWSLAASPCLWRSLDLRARKFDISTATSLASRCSSLQKLYFEGEESAEAIISLKVRTLIQLSGNFYGRVNDVTLSKIVDMNKLLEIIEFGSSYCTGISSEGIKSIAMCCLNLKKLWLSGLKEVNSIAINALSSNCHSLVEIAFTDCEKVDEIALTNLVSVQFLSIAGTKRLNSYHVIEHWIKFENLLALDVSRTDISANAIDRLLSYSPTLKVLCAFHCGEMEQDINFSPRNKMGVELISILTSISTLLDSQDIIMIMPWIEQVLSRCLLHFANINQLLPTRHFWLYGGIALMTKFLKSLEEEVQRRAIRIIPKFATLTYRGVDDDDIIDQRVEAIVDWVTIFLNLVKSSGEGVKLEVAKAINMLFSSEEFASVTAKRGMEVLMKLLESRNKFILEEASNALRCLRERVPKNQYKSIIFECGDLEVLKNLLQRWTSISENVLKNIIGTLAIMTSDERINVEMSKNGCLDALVAITQNCVFVGVLEQVVQVFANLIGNTHTNDNNIIVGYKLRALQTLVQLIRSPDKHTCQEAVEALSNLSFDERNREAIVAVDGIETLDIHVTIMATLWNLVFKPEIALRVVEKKGIQVLVRICLVSGSELARFLAILVMAYIFHVLPEGCIYTIRNSSNEPTKTLRIGMKHIEDFINSFLDDETLKCDDLSLTSIDLYRAVEFARIRDVHQLKCSGTEIARFVDMLGSSYSSIKSCAAFTLMQFTTPGYQNRVHHIRLINDKKTMSTTFDIWFLL
ncbi:protein ARABIDILLO 1-like [Impatiens glandulifera]|uniref:protein ARABIDILLO 1-like n=1 Tax=Impatiens glandulifera TaxID=253017 RepID=UPI001FB15009|nr:protein ARABIDILLO 1-like [Impatiens glandulifera]